jgi:hypothetical protein
MSEEAEHGFTLLEIKLGGEEEPFRVLSWQDDVAAATSRPQKLAGDDDDL